MTASLENATVLVVGAGIMGSGIAQVAAQAGHPVMLFDSQSGAAAAAKLKLATIFEKLVARGKLSAEASTQTLSLIEPIENLDHAASAGLVVEAVIEDIETKRSLLLQLEGIVSQDCVLATNTSSISVTALANGMQHPERLVGMHFFNPAALMKLVEVVSGLQTSPTVAESIFKLAESWDKVAVNTRSTPGFIVNRIARPFYAETLALLQEQAATPTVIDACLRTAGFRMGPCELMDLIGHDTNLAVTRSVYAANYYDKRFAPSLVQQELLDGGLLGRKSGRGFYDYSQPAETPATDCTAPATLPSTDRLSVHGGGSVAERFARILKQRKCSFERIENSDWCGLQVAAAQLRLTDGRPASQLGTEIAVFDLVLTDNPDGALAWSHAADASEQWVNEAPQWLAVCGFQPQRIVDTPGLVVARTIAMLINEAADAVLQGVCSATDADVAMKLGVNYPAGPFEWLANWDANAVIELLDRLDTYYRGERYRVSPWLRRQGWSRRVE